MPTKTKTASPATNGKVRSRKKKAVPAVNDEPLPPKGIKNYTMTTRADGQKILSTPLGDFVWCPPGEYEIDDPPRKVKLTYGYWMGIYTVTQTQWEELMGSNPSHFQGPEVRPTPAALLGGISGGLNDLPVESVDWNQVQDFCKKASERDELPYRLPTEAEWEYAALAGQRFAYAGSDDPDEVAWSSENSGGHTHPVGQKKPNAWGIYDMSGNVWEWTFSDWSAKGPEGVDPGWVEIEIDALTPKEMTKLEKQYNLSPGTIKAIREGRPFGYACPSPDDKEDHPDPST